MAEIRGTPPMFGVYKQRRAWDGDLTWFNHQTCWFNDQKFGFNTQFWRFHRLHHRKLGLSQPNHGSNQCKLRWFNQNWLQMSRNCRSLNSTTWVRISWSSLKSTKTLPKDKGLLKIVKNTDMKLVPQGFYQSSPAETTSPASPVAPFRTLGARCWYHTAGWQLGAGRPKAVKQSRRKPCTWARHPPLQQYLNGLISTYPLVN